MPNSEQHALLFLDVDGPLIPFGAPSHQLRGRRPVEYSAPESPSVDSNPLLHRLNPEDGPRLASLPCDLVWATTWMSDANDCICPRLGLPRLPVVDWPDPTDEEETGRLHWKTRPLVDWAAGRAFVWVDDEITEADRVWVAAHHRGRALLHRVDPRTGLTDEDFAAIGRWLQQMLAPTEEDPGSPGRPVRSRCSTIPSRPLRAARLRSPLVGMLPTWPPHGC